jgi:transformation/transcription domain-associated protein
MLSYVAYVLRGLGDQHESHGDSLLLASLRLLQDIPAHDISSRRVRTYSHYVAVL